MCSNYRFPRPFAHWNSRFLTNVHGKHTTNRLFSISRFIDYEILNRFDATNVFVDFNRLRWLIVSALIYSSLKFSMYAFQLYVQYQAWKPQSCTWRLNLWLNAFNWNSYSMELIKKIYMAECMYVYSIAVSPYTWPRYRDSTWQVKSRVAVDT